MHIASILKESGFFFSFPPEYRQLENPRGCSRQPPPPPPHTPVLKVVLEMQYMAMLWLFVGLLFSPYRLSLNAWTTLNIADKFNPS